MWEYSLKHDKIFVLAKVTNKCVRIQRLAGLLLGMSYKN